MNEGIISFATAVVCELAALALFGLFVLVLCAITAKAELIWGLFDLLMIGGFSMNEIGMCTLELATL